MADLVDTSAAWETGIYQIETTDPVVGGVPNPATGAGMSNIPHLQLARRTQWLRGNLSGFNANIAYTVNGAIPAANIGARGVWTPATAGALTLPAVTSVPVGASFYIAAGGAAVTIAPNGADEIFGTDNVSLGTLALSRGEDVVITRGGAAWALTGGSAALRLAGVLAVGNYRTADAVGAGATLTAGDSGECFVYGGTTPITFTLPSLATVAPGGCFEFINTGTADVTVQRAGSDQIDNGPSAVNSIVVPPNRSLKLVRASASTLWHPVSPTAVAPQAIGDGQTWQDVTASRVANTAYQNTTGRPIQVVVNWDQSGGEVFQISTNGTTWSTLVVGGNVGTSLTNAQVIIPNGIFYRITAGAPASWWELR